MTIWVKSEAFRPATVNHAPFAEFLVKAGIDSISLNPDTIIPVILRLGKISN